MAKDNNLHDPGERVPLLLSPSLERSQQFTAKQPKLRPWQTPDRLILLLMLAVLLVSLGDQWMDSPQTRIFEAIICYRYYEKFDPTKISIGREAIGPGAIGGVAEMWCKADAVQSELAALRGWQLFFDGFPTLFLAIPLGYAADRYGRKPILFLGTLAVVLQPMWIQMVTWFWQAFDIRMVWLSTLFASIGGGQAVLASVFYVILSDITPEAERAAVFMRVGAVNLLAALVMPPFAAVLMEISPWIPNLGGTVLEILPLFLFPLLPETLNYRDPSLPPHPHDPPAQEQPQTTTSLQNRPPSPNPTTYATRWITTSLTSLTFLTNDHRIPLLILPYSIHTLIMVVGRILLQYTSKRYSMKISSAILLITIRMGIITLLLFSILPYISNLVMRKFALSPQKKDLYLARTSFLIFAVGWTLVGLAPNVAFLTIALAITSFGYGAFLLVRSFLTSLVPKHHIARLYSILSIVETLGVMAGSPLMAGLFKRGLALGGFGIGLPFYFLGLLAACSTVVLFLISLRKGEDERLAVSEDE